MAKNMDKNLCMIVCILAIMWSAYAYAQTPNIPGSADTGRLKQRLLLPEHKHDGNIIPKDDMPIDDDIPSAPDGFILRKINLTGINAFPTNHFNNLIAEYIGRPVDLNVLNHLATQITKIYRENGYFLSRALIPEQEVVNGRVINEEPRSKLRGINWGGA